MPTRVVAIPVIPQITVSLLPVAGRVGLGVIVILGVLLGARLGVGIADGLGVGVTVGVTFGLGVGVTVGLGASVADGVALWLT